MKNLEKKEIDLDKLLNKLNNLSFSYAHSLVTINETLKKEKQILHEKKSIERKSRSS